MHKNLQLDNKRSLYKRVVPSSVARRKKKKEESDPDHDDGSQVDRARAETVIYDQNPEMFKDPEIKDPEGRRVQSAVWPSVLSRLLLYMLPRYV